MIPEVIPEVTPVRTGGAVWGEEIIKVRKNVTYIYIDMDLV